MDNQDCELIRRLAREEIEKYAKAGGPINIDPQPTPTLEDELRELVGKHECLRAELHREAVGRGGSRFWFWKTQGAYLYESGALTVVRGIVKAMCGERSSMLSFTESWDWSPSDEPGERKWVSNGPNHGRLVDTELAAIDALLTAMKN